MTSRLEALSRRRPRAATTVSFGGGQGWDAPPFWTGIGLGDREDIEENFASYVTNAYKANGVVFACILARLLVFSEARFQFQEFENGRPAGLFDDASLSLLERPWPNGTTGELLARMEQDTSLAGNFYATIVGTGTSRRIRRLRPDWVTIITGAPDRDDGSPGGPNDLEAEVVGYLYSPRGGMNDPTPTLLTREQVCHWSPIPDPDAQWRGMSWLTPVVREVKADSSAMKHKLKFFEHGTVGGLKITYDKSVSMAQVKAAAEMFAEQHAGVDNAYKTYHFGGGADAAPLGADFKALDFKSIIGQSETRIAAASGVGAVIAQLSEGMQGSTLNAGNFNAAKRRFADGTVRPLWRSAAAALETLVLPPRPRTRLWYDARDVAFLQEDQKDEAEIQAKQAQTIAELVREGFDADAAVEAVTTNDLAALVGTHSGLFSIQLQPAGAAREPTEE